MAETYSTGWLSVTSGQKSYITAPKGRITLVRARWRGKSYTSYGYNYTDASGAAGPSYGLSASLSAPTGSGTLVYVSGSCSFGAPRSGDWSITVTPSGGSSSSNNGTGTSGSHSAGKDMPSAASVHFGGSFPEGDASWTYSVQATWETSTTTQTQNPKVTVGGIETSHAGTLNNGVVSGWYTVSGFVAGAVNEVLHTIAGSGRADVEIEITYIPAATATQVEPEAFARHTRDTLELQAGVVIPSGNTATAWHARVTAGMAADMSSSEFTWDSYNDQTDWDYSTDGGGTWIPLTGAGAPTNAILRFTPPVDDMALGRWYWQAEARDNDTVAWGEQSGIRQFRLVLSVAERYALEIGGVTFTAKHLRVTETRDGELGAIEFTLILSNEAGLPSDGDVVYLAVRDTAGNEDQFEGWLQGDPARLAPATFRCYVKLPDAILAERFIRVNYASQDVGLSFKQAVDTYGSPLDSTGINTSTGFIRPMETYGRTLLDMAMELKEQYGLLFWVRATDQRVFLVLPDDLETPRLTVVRGAVE